MTNLIIALIAIGLFVWGLIASSHIGDPEDEDDEKDSSGLLDDDD